MTDTDKIMDVADVLAAYLTDELPEVSRLVFNGEIAEMAARAIAAIEARVRAEVAGTTRKKIRVEMRWTFHREPWVGHGTDAATCTQCEVATDAAVLAIAAGSSPDTTPEGRS